MPTAARDITPPKSNGDSPKVSNSLGLSASPPAPISFSSLGYAGVSAKIVGQSSSAKQLKPFNTKDIKILLLENVNKVGREALQSQGYQIEYLVSSLPESELIAKIR